MTGKSKTCYHTSKGRPPILPKNDVLQEQRPRKGLTIYNAGGSLFLGGFLGYTGGTDYGPDGRAGVMFMTTLVVNLIMTNVCARSIVSESSILRRKC